jgi:hypothetical protein
LADFFLTEANEGNKGCSSGSGCAILQAAGFVNASNRSGLAFATAGFRFARMKVANLEAALKARPFRPFEIRGDGEAIAVKHPEQVFLAEQKTTAIIAAGDRIHIFDVAAISKIALLRGSSSKGAYSVY